MTGQRTAVITGATSGLGLQCARALLQRDESWYVVLAVRDAARGQALAQALPDPARATVMTLDLASLASVRRFTSEYAAQSLPPTTALVCNAGIQTVSGAEVTADGVELSFGTNHLGHFALVDGLLPSLTHPGRIVVVTSDTHDPRKHTGMPHPRYGSAAALAQPALAGQAEGRQRYTTSKLCNVLYAYELDRRLGSGTQGVTVNSFNPGLMPGSGLARDYGALQRFAWRYVMPVMRVLPQVRSVRQSGAHLAALAADPSFDGVTGRYFDGLKPIESSVDSRDLHMATDLWQTSERLVAS